MVVRGKRRDSAYYSLLADEWPARRAAMAEWLDPANFDTDGRARAALALLPGSRRPASPTAGLSAREREVLALVAVGLPNKSIARRLEISEKTVKAHLTRVFALLGVADRTSAALWAQRHGLV